MADSKGSTKDSDSKQIMDSILDYISFDVKVFNCAWCNGLHQMKRCPEFIEAKQATTTLPYYAKIMRMRDEEVNGFAAAGTMTRRIGPNGTLQLLLIREFRNGVSSFNFIGGKRDNKVETPYQTAMRELKEEATGHLDSKDVDKITKTKPIVTFWIPKSKYILFVIDCDADICTKVVGSKSMWLECKTAISVMHKFCKEICHVVDECLPGIIY